MNPAIEDTLPRTKENKPFKAVWRRMINLCYNPTVQAANPTYVGHTVCKEWLKSHVFAEWMKQQPWENAALSRHVLDPNATEYNPQTCAFVSYKLIRFLQTRPDKNDQLPTGVKRVKATGLYRAVCNVPGEKNGKILGTYPTANQAHAAWRREKQRILDEITLRERDPRVRKALRNRFAPPIN